MIFDVEKIRKDFPQLNQTVNDCPLIYLDNGATTLKCQAVIDKVDKHYSKETSNVHRGIHTLSEAATTEYEQSRNSLQKFINAAHAHEVIFTKGTTDSINLVAQSYGRKYLNKDQTILVSRMEHHSNIVPWQMIAEEKGAEVKEIPISESGEILIDKYSELLKENDVAIVAMTAISNVLGTINPVIELVELAHHSGAKVLVDAAQVPLHGPLNVQQWDADFVALSAHKAIGPTGVGVLYGKEEILNMMPPYQGGGAMIKSVSFEKTTFNILPEKFEAGTPNIAGIIAFKEAIDYLSDLDISALENHMNGLTEYAHKKLGEIKGLKILGTAKHKAPIMSFTLEGVHPHDLGTLLDRQGVAIRTGHHCAQPLMNFYNIEACSRASFAFYNTKKEVDKLVAAIKKAQEFL